MTTTFYNSVYQRSFLSKITFRLKYIGDNSNHSSKMGWETSMQQIWRCLFGFTSKDVPNLKKKMEAIGSCKGGLSNYKITTVTIISQKLNYKIPEKCVEEIERLS